jgi:hypothetical protein
MESHSNLKARSMIDVHILHESVCVGRGSVLSRGKGDAFVRVADFPLGTDSFIELAPVDCDDACERAPARVVANTGNGLELAFEGKLPLWLATLESHDGSS